MVEDAVHGMVVSVDAVAGGLYVAMGHIAPVVDADIKLQKLLGNLNMKRIYIFLLLTIVFFTNICANAQVHVRGYTRKDGTYVQPHMRSSPNGIKSDNWSTRGTINSYVGEIGRKDLSAYTSPKDSINVNKFISDSKINEDINKNKEVDSNKAKSVSKPLNSKEYERSVYNRAKKECNYGDSNTKLLCIKSGMQSIKELDMLDKKFNN